MAFFYAPMLMYPNVHSASVLENHHFHHPLTNFRSGSTRVQKRHLLSISKDGDYDQF